MKASRDWKWKKIELFVAFKLRILEEDSIYNHAEEHFILVDNCFLIACRFFFVGILDWNNSQFVSVRNKNILIKQDIFILRKQICVSQRGINEVNVKKKYHLVWLF